MKRIIEIETGVKYLSQSKHFTELPKNCIFDKGKVGCGGTTLAINNRVPYVIAVPFVSLIENKTAQHPEIFGVYGGIEKSQIKKFVKQNPRGVIMTTYDSLPKVTECITAANYKLLVDEYHLLFNHYSFRETAVNGVLEEYKKYREYCFMTATQLEDEFILDELKDLDIVEAKWSDVTEVKVNSIHCIRGVENSTVDLINSFLEDDTKGNLYLFVNSVEFIKSMVKNCDLTNENCNVIYSKTNKKRVGIKRGVLPSDKNGSIPTKRINMLTSTVFEGSDIYDENGKIVIVSDGSKANTLIDISTSFQQIAGRIRNSKHLNSIMHLYSTTRYNGLDYEAFKELSEKTIVRTKNLVEKVNDIGGEEGAALVEVAAKHMNDYYLSRKDDYLIFNPNLIKLDLYNFKICKHLYTLRVTGLQEEYQKYGYGSTNFSHISETNISPLDMDGFEKTVKELEEFYLPDMIKVYSDEQEAVMDAAFKKYTFLKKALNQFGYDGIKEMEYVQTNIKRKLINLTDTSTENKVMKMLKTYNDFSAGNFVAGKVLKTRFKKIYAELGINKTPKGSDIEQYFNVNSCFRKVNGKSIRGFEILNPKMILV